MYVCFSSYGAGQEEGHEGCPEGKHVYVRAAVVVEIDTVGSSSAIIAGHCPHIFIPSPGIIHFLLFLWFQCLA